MSLLRFLLVLTLLPTLIYLIASPVRTFKRVRTENGSIWAFIFLLLLPFFSFLLCIIQSLIDTKDFVVEGRIHDWSQEKSSDNKLDTAILVEDDKRVNPRRVRRIIMEEEEY